MSIDSIRKASALGSGYTDMAERQARSRRLMLWLGLAVALVVLCGAGYKIYLDRTLPPSPSLPAGPPHARAIAQSSSADMLQGNFVVTTALYRSSDSPARVVAYYRNVLKAHRNQIGRFQDRADSTLPASAPEALQNMPPLFDSPTGADAHAASYLYTEYHVDLSDIGIAVDARYPKGPTLVYLEMLTQPG